MSAVESLTLTSTTLSVNGELEGDVLAVRFAGNASHAASDALERVLTRLHEEAVRHRVVEVAVDLQRLVFMNSACFKNFVIWIGRVQELPPEKQYRVRFLSNVEMPWQRRSLHALKCFAVQLVIVEN